MRFGKQSGTTTGSGGRRLSAALIATAVLVGSGLAFGVAAPSAAAADRTATITLSGITSNTYPVGGNTVWVAPGTNLTITQAPINVAGNQGLLGTVGNLLGGVVSALNPVVGLKATVDLSSVGKGTPILAGGQSVATPALAKGVYPIAWSFTAVTALGQNVALNGNQLNPLGIKLNAQNRYIGYIVSDTKSPCGGAQCIALQTPTLSVAPSLPVVGQLPTVTVPGQNVNVPIPSIPGVNAPVTGDPSSAAATAAAAAAAAAATPTPEGYTYTAPGCTGPCLVVPKGGGGGGEVGGASEITLGDLGDAAAGSGGGGDAAGTSADGAGLVGNGNAADGQLAVDRAFAAEGGLGTPAGSGTPLGLALAAGAALVATSVLWFVRRHATQA